MAVSADLPIGASATIGALEARIASYGVRRAVVAFSGGVDSAVVVAVAVRTLGPRRVSAVTALSPSYPGGELEAARNVASSLGVLHRTIRTQEVQREAYARNDGQRCFHCKAELFSTLGRLAGMSAGPDVVVLAGANADDALDVRPGLRAGELFGVRNPLLEEGLGKGAVRAVAARLGLPVADKPALACLSSRVAFGIRISPELLERIDRAEAAVRALGFAQVRVRHLPDRASIEVDPPRVPLLLADERLPGLLAALRALGWERVEVDPAGYRAGAMNATMVTVGPPAPRATVRSARTAAGSASAPPGSPPRP